jgi:nitrate/TMAO reductase-like tetraheme cytochrome c subunit
MPNNAKKRLKMRENATTRNAHNFHQNSHNAEQRSADNIKTGDNYGSFGPPQGSSTPL